MKRLLRGAAAMLGASELAGCGSEDEQQPTQRITNSDTSFRGVRVGDSPETVGRAFGPRCNESSAGACESGLGDTGTLPMILPGGWRYSRYADATVFSRRGRIKAIVITYPGAESSRGVGIGDELQDARDRYQGIRCTVQTFEDSTGNPYCTAPLATGRVIMFGGDPVDTIVIGEPGLG